MPSANTTGVRGWLEWLFAAPHCRPGVLATVGGCFTDRVDQGNKIVGMRLRRRRRQSQPHHFPPPRHGEPFSVGGTQIVTMGFRVGGQWAKHCSGIGVHKSECRDGGTLTG